MRKITTGRISRSRADLISRAIANGSNVIVVHHPNGFWFSDKEKRVLDTQYGEYMRMLLQNRISLFGFHLPLDAHPTLGNNATVYNKLGLKGTVMGAHMGRISVDRTFPTVSWRPTSVSVA